MILSLLSAVWPWVAGAVGTAITAALASWIHHVFVIGRLKTQDAVEQASFDYLDHLLETAATQAVHQVTGDIGQKPIGDIAQDAFVILKTLATPETFAALAKVAKVTGEAVWPYLLARLHGASAAAAAKVLTVPAGDAAEFDKLPYAQKLAAVAALGKPAAQVELVHTVKTTQPPRGP